MLTNWAEAKKGRKSRARPRPSRGNAYMCGVFGEPKLVGWITTIYGYFFGEELGQVVG